MIAYEAEDYKPLEICELLINSIYYLAHRLDCVESDLAAIRLIENCLHQVQWEITSQSEEECQDDWKHYEE